MRLDELNLTVRAYNVLGRAGYKTVEDVLERVRCKHDLAKIRGAGTKVVNEILEKIRTVEPDFLKRT